jgi:Zn ribbon nucleic-acid-binding protein
MSAYRKALRKANKKNQDIYGAPMPEFKPEFVYKFCPRCKKWRNMMLWSSGPGHETAKCVHCGREWIFNLEGRLTGQMHKVKCYGQRRENTHFPYFSFCPKCARYNTCPIKKVMERKG